MAVVHSWVINTYFNAQIYESYEDLLSDIAEVRASYNFGIKTVGNWGNMMDMMQELEVTVDLQNDLDHAFQLIADGEKIDQDQVYEFMGLLGFFIDNLQKEVDIFEATFAMGFFELLNLFIKSACRRMYNSLLNYEKSLKDLEVELKSAEHKKWGAYADKAIDFIQLGITILAPELSFVANLGIAVGGLVADEYLGTGGPDGSKIGRTALTTLSGPFGKAMKWGGDFEKFNKVVGVGNGGYDTKNLSEIETAKQLIAEIEIKIAAVKASYRTCAQLFPSWYDSLVRLNNQLTAAYTKIKALEREASQGRDMLKKELGHLNYKTPVVWRREPRS